MNRRSFLAAAAALLVAPDPEQLLWRPGARLISIPRPWGIRVEFTCTYDPVRHVVLERLTARHGQRDAGCTWEVLPTEHHGNAFAMYEGPALVAIGERLGVNPERLEIGTPEWTLPAGWRS